MNLLRTSNKVALSHSSNFTTTRWATWSMDHFILVLSHTFGYLEQKLHGRLWKRLVFLKSNFYVSENFKFQWGLSEMAYFIIGYLSTKLGTSVDGHEQIITWMFHWNHPGNERQMYRHWQENMILHYKTFYFGKTSAETWHVSLPKKLDIRKNKLAICPVVFAPRTQTYATQLKQWTIAPNIPARRNIDDVLPIKVHFTICSLKTLWSIWWMSLLNHSFKFWAQVVV
jgi:hypothetical protein